MKLKKHTGTTFVTLQSAEKVQSYHSKSHGKELNTVS